MRKKNIIIFSYDFPHLKTKLGMQVIDIYSTANIFVVAAPWKQLNLKKSSIRTETSNKEYLHPREISNKYGWEYYVSDHNSSETRKVVENINPDVGIILGSRIINDNIIKMFNLGVINFHPGVLPQNRGLNTIQNAILRSLPQGVTTHIIDKSVDQGTGIFLDCLNVEVDDTFFDISKKILNLEMEKLRDLVVNDFQFDKSINLTQEFKKNKELNLNEEKKILDMFMEYKKNYNLILEEYKEKNYFEK